MQENSNEWLYRRIVDGSPDAIIFSNCDGLIELWNRGAENIFGFNACEMIGQSVDLIVPEKLRARHGQGYRKVMATGLTRYGQELLAVPAMRKDGSRISIEFSILLARAPSGEIAGSAAVIRDVTVRWQKEKVLRDRLSALEMRE